MNTFPRALAFLLCWSCSILTAQASHVLGANLTYEYAGTAASPFQYRVTALVFRDLSSAVTDNQLTLSCGKNECGNTLPGSFTSVLTRTRTLTPPPGTCPGGGNRNYEILVLEGLMQLPPARWTLSINMENRGFGLSNLVQSETQSAYVAAILDNSSGLVNSSPKFISNRLIQLSGTQPQPYSLAAFDAEGDSLVYQLVMPLRAQTGPTQCGIPVDGSPAPHFQLHQATGELRPQPGIPVLGAFALAARVDEYRRLSGAWQQIGSITRDIAYTSVNSTNQNPAFTRVERSTNPGIQLLGQPIGVLAGQPITLNLTAVEADAGQTLQLSSDVGSIVPGVTFQDQGGGHGQLTWQVPATLAPGHYVLPATAIDNACPFSGVAVQTLVFRVLTPLAVRPRLALAQAPFPLPFTDEVRFQLAGGGAQAVEVMDELGRRVARLASSPDGTVVWRPAAGLAPGLYLARSLDGRQTARLPYAGQ